MTHETHRCSVEGCPSFAEFRVLLHDVDHVSGAVRFTPDETCPYRCLEHAADNQQHARGERGTHASVACPHTHRSGERGLSIYLAPPHVDAT